MTGLRALTQAAACCRLVSVDLFDTLLLFPPVPELARFGAIARWQHDALAATSLPTPSPEALWQARLAVTKPAYDAIHADPARGEVRLGEIFDAMRARLGLPDSAQAPLFAAERAYHAAVLRPNAALLSVLSGLGRPVVVTSDTPMPGTMLRDLLAGLAPTFVPHAVWSSADAQCTKRYGTLYGHVAKAHGLDAAAVVHVGDHASADVDRAIAAGMRAVHLPRPWPWRVLRDLRDRLIRHQLARRGWLHQGPRIALTGPPEPLSDA